MHASPLLTLVCSTAGAPVDSCAGRVQVGATQSATRMSGEFSDAECRRVKLRRHCFNALSHTAALEGAVGLGVELGTQG
jgi:hypothetical protein